MAALCAAALTLWPAEASAQRHSRPFRGRVSTVIVASPVFFGYGLPDPFWWGHPGWYPYRWHAPYYWPGRYSPLGSARLQIAPRRAEVYLDGYFVGTVDRFDGVFQRLEVPPGRYELAVYLEGYRTFREKVLFPPGGTIDIRHELQPLDAGEAPEPRPEPSAEQPRPPRGRRGVHRPYGADQQRENADSGTLAVRVRPAGATLIVDGEEWPVPERDGPLLIELQEGAHEIEVRKDGFSTFRRTVEVRSGETVPLNVSLSR